MAILVASRMTFGGEIDDVAQGHAKNGAVPGVIPEERTQVVFDVLPFGRQVETVVADSRPAFSDMRGERGIGSQQKLVGETPEEVVIGVDDDEFREVAAEGIAAVDATHQEASHGSQAVTEISRPVRHAIDLAQVQAGLVEAEIEKRHIEVGQQELLERTAWGQIRGGYRLGNFRGIARRKQIGHEMHRFAESQHGDAPDYQRQHARIVAGVDKARVPRADREIAGELRDRKSTRLNSSHLGISYA